MEHLNWGYLQLGLVALAFGGSSGLVDQPCVQKARPGTTLERGTVPQVTGKDLGEKDLMAL